MAKIDINNGVVKIDGSAMAQASGAEKVNSLMFRINSGLLEVSANSGTTWSKVAMSPADILTAIKTVDGAGSGLDADKLGGYDQTSANTASTIVRRDGAGGIFASFIQFLQTEQGIQWTTNTDSASIKFYNTADSDTNCRLQFTIGDNGNEYFSFRGVISSTETELLKMLPSGGVNGITYLGNKVWHAGNDGAGSGLDADKLGGVASASYLLNTQTAAKAMMIDQQALGDARDLNTLANLGPGIWSTSNSAEANTITNGPTNSSLATECVVVQYDMGSTESTTYIIQELYQKRTGENKIYRFHRYKQNATFTPWAQVYDSVNNIINSMTADEKTKLGRVPALSANNVFSTGFTVTGDLSVTGDILYDLSDIRLKTQFEGIEDPISKILSLDTGFYYYNDIAKNYGFTNTKRQIGLKAQQVQEIIPEAVGLAPFDNDNGVSKSGEEYLTIRYEKLVPLLIEALKAQQKEIELLKEKVGV